jgi:hypothetical protein
MNYIPAGDIHLRYPQFEPPAPPDDSDDSSDDDAGNLEGDDYQYNGGDYEDYEYADCSRNLTRGRTCCARRGSSSHRIVGSPSTK